MKREDLVKEVKTRMGRYVYKNFQGDICISDKGVLNIIKFIENEYHGQLFPLQKEKPPKD